MTNTKTNNPKWAALMDDISGMTEDQLAASIERELEDGRRASVVVRMHQRYCALRKMRERQALLAKCD